MRPARPLLRLLLALAVAALACGAPEAPLIPPTTPTATIRALPEASATGTVALAPATTPAVGATATLPAPTSTPDPDLPGWTVLIYLGADETLADQAEADLAEMAAWGAVTGVNIVVQRGAMTADGASSRRTILSPRQEAPAEDLPGVIPGEAASLDDFLAWGLESFPARHVALVLWGVGAGPDGLLFTTGLGDGLTRAELASGLGEGLERAGRSHLDLIAFAAGLMGHFEVYEAIQPFASLGVASADLLPAGGWEFDALFALLAADPVMSPVQLARHMVADVARTVPAAGTAAFDLSGWPALQSAVTELALALLAEPALVEGAVAAAREGASVYALQAPLDGSGRPIDLWQFAAALEREAGIAGEVAAAAGEVTAAIESMSLAPRDDPAGNRGSGLAIGFPAAEQAPTPGASPWDRLVAGFPALGEGAPPSLTVTKVLTPVASWQAPAYLELAVAGRSVVEVRWQAARQEADGAWRLVAEGRLPPAAAPLAAGDPSPAWPDGLQRGLLIWDTSVFVLEDGEASGLVFPWPAAADDALLAVLGHYVPAAGAAVPASLIFPAAGGAPLALWALAAGTPYAVAPAPGDAFQVDDLFLEESGAARPAPGRSWPLDGQLLLGRRPAPTGDYTLRLLASAPARPVAVADQSVAVRNDDLLPGLRAVLDPELGVSFLMPESWRPTVREDARLVGGDATGEILLNVARLPAAPDGSAPSAPALAAEVLTAFGEVAVLYESEAIVAGEPARRVAYGYDDVAGEPRTGVFAAFTHEGQGYIVDVDGPQAREDELLTALDTLLADWRVLPGAFAEPVEGWVREETAALHLTRPASWRGERLDGGWERFSAPGGGVFAAIRATATGAEEPGTALEAWLAVAASGVTEFVAGEPGRVALGGRAWTRGEFAYASSTGAPVGGAIWVGEIEGSQVVAWIEAPAERLMAVEEVELAVMLAGLEVLP